MRKSVSQRQGMCELCNCKGVQNNLETVMVINELKIAQD
jgi:hypothetical protein